ncbi:hypothetical protein IEE94_15130 [Yimella sp. cx-573]|nr:hypothetical protein [Yimella sp. cx-573]
MSVTRSEPATPARVIFVVPRASVLSVFRTVSNATGRFWVMVLKVGRSCERATWVAALRVAALVEDEEVVDDEAGELVLDEVVDEEDVDVEDEAGELVLVLDAAEEVASGVLAAVLSAPVPQAVSVRAATAEPAAAMVIGRVSVRNKKKLQVCTFPVSDWTHAVSAAPSRTHSHTQHRTFPGSRPHVTGHPRRSSPLGLLIKGD